MANDIVVVFVMVVLNLSTLGFLLGLYILNTKSEYQDAAIILVSTCSVILVCFSLSLFFSYFFRPS